MTTKENIELKNQNTKNKKNFNWIINLIGWSVFLALLYFAWIQIQPLIKNLNYLTGKASSTLQNIDKDAKESNEILNKVNHPINNIDKFNPF